MVPLPAPNVTVCSTALGQRSKLHLGLETAEVCHIASACAEFDQVNCCTRSGPRRAILALSQEARGAGPILRGYFASTRIAWKSSWRRRLSPRSSSVRTAAPRSKQRQAAAWSTVVIAVRKSAFSRMPCRPPRHLTIRMPLNSRLRKPAPPQLSGSSFLWWEWVRWWQERLYSWLGCRRNPRLVTQAQLLPLARSLSRQGSIRLACPNHWRRSRLGRA